MSFLGTFEHTTGKTWGGTQITPTVLMATSILGGFFGLDHLLLRSPRTAFFKFFFNIVSLGLWYWYDVIQVTSDMDFVKTFGYTIPVIGPTGLGIGIVGDENPAPQGTPSPWIFVVYILLAILPFGINNFIVGDTNGGGVKFLATYFIFTTIFGLLWTLYSGFYAIFQTQSLLTKGTDRPFPFSLFMKPYGSAPGLAPPKLAATEKALEEPGFLEKIYTSLAGFVSLDFFKKIYNMIFGIVEKPILKATVAVMEPVVDIAQTTKNAATESAPNTIAQTGGALNAATNVAVLLSAQQQGGADTTSPKYIFLAATALIFIGSVSLTYFRFWRAKKNEPTNHIEKNDVPPEQNDAPPGPRIL
jgi:hypothetical protein